VYYIAAHDQNFAMLHQRWEKARHTFSSTSLFQMLAYPTQKLFTEAILKFFRKIIPEKWHNFRNQVTDNFRIISEQNIRVLE
jgi:hypothetical protein